MGFFLLWIFFTRLVVSHLAKFHSVSYALIQDIGVEAFKAKFPHTRERMMKRQGVSWTINTLMIDSILSKLCCLLKVFAHKYFISIL